MNQDESYEVMVVEVKELGTEGLNVAIYDTRTDDEGTFTTAVGNHDSSADDPEWRKMTPDDLDATELVQYIDHEWRTASVEYTEEGLIKEGGTIERRHDKILVGEPTTLSARIERMSDCFIVTVEADGITQAELELSDAELGLGIHPALRD